MVLVWISRLLDVVMMVGFGRTWKDMSRRNSRSEFGFCASELLEHAHRRPPARNTKRQLQGTTISTSSVYNLHELL
jgi:hypothetical protein